MMNQIKIGNYIQQKRKEKNLTQEQFAEKLGVSNKTISKWECGKALPNYLFIEKICEILEISTSELFSGEDNSNLNEKQMIEMLENIQKLESAKKTIFGVLLMILGIASYCMSQLWGGSDFKDFISGILLGMSIAEMLAGIFITASSISK